MIESTVIDFKSEKTLPWDHLNHIFDWFCKRKSAIVPSHLANN